jgi:hypothetical protein
LEIEPLTNSRFLLRWPATGESPVLQESSTVGPNSVWLSVPEALETAGAFRQVVVSASGQSRFFRLFRFSAEPARIIETSPADGEMEVSVHRETVFRFDAPLAADTLLSIAIVSARAAGTSLLTRSELATDRRSVALFYQEPIPANTRVQVRFDGFLVLDDAGRALDADADGLPGGVLETSFTTVNATAVGNTAVVGQVLASEKNPDGSDRPLRGVTITVDGAEQDLRTQTAADGTFRLQPAPAGRFFVHIDGRTSPLSRWPEGAYYPFVGKTWEAEPGRTNNLAGGDGRIFLPLVPADALQTVNATDTTVISFSPSVLAATPTLVGVEIRVPANALFSDNGTRGGRVGIAPVAPDRLPEPLPPGLSLPLVITIQTDGPSNFDRPVPVRFPNLPDPVTGDVLPPGAKTALWSFDHDTGRWEIAGPMTISADGRFAETDPGVGVRQPGWHGSAPGGPGGGPGGPGGGGPGDDCEACDDDPPKEPPDCNFFDPFCEGNNCRKEARLLANSVQDLILDIGAANMTDGAPGCAAGIAGSAARAARDCALDLEPCGGIDIGNPIIDGAVGAALGCIPKVGAILGAAWTFKSVIFNVDAVIDCAGKQGQRPSLHGAIGGVGGSFNPVAARLKLLLSQQLEVCEASSNLVAAWFGPVWAVAQTPQEGDLYASFFQAVADTVQPDSDGQRAVTAAERATLLGRPRPSSTSAADVEQLLHRLNLMATGTFRAGTPEADAFLVAQAEWDAVVAERVAEGWETLLDGIFRVAAVVSSLAEPAAGSSSYGTWTSSAANPNLHATPSDNATSLEPAFPKRSHFFDLQDLATGFRRQGRLTPDGKLPPQILAMDRRYRISFLDPETGRIGSATFRSASAGLRTRIPAAPLLQDASPDRDGDGLGDRAEWILGSDPANPDSDGDGLTDGAEFQTGDNPIDGREVVIGVIGGADTPGTAEHLAIDGEVAVVADGTSGVAVFDLTDPRSPVRIAQIAVPQARSVALSGGLALVGRGNGASLLDLRLPSQPSVLTNFAGSAVTSVALASPFGYFGRGPNVEVVDLVTARLLPAVALGTTVHDLAVDGDVLHVLTASDLRLYRRVGATLQELSRTPVAGGPSPLEAGRKLFAGGGRAYVGYFDGFTILDVSNQTAPVVLARQPRTQAAIHDLVENGSGQLATTTSSAGTSTLAVSLYEVLSGTSTTNFVTTLPTPGDPRSIVIHRGLAYVADGPGGLQVLNFLPRDTAGQRPSIAFGPPLNTQTSLEIGSTPLLTFVTGDDRQVREVELYRDGQRIASAGSFPFQIPVPIAPADAGQGSVVFRARAIDTAGNERWTDERRVTLTPDQTPPEIYLLSPANGGEFLPGIVDSITVGFSEAMSVGSLANGLLLNEAGPDGNHATADDRAIPVSIGYQGANLTAELRPTPAFPAGRYRLRATTGVTDASGLALASERVWTFRIPPPAVIASTPNNNSNHRPGTLTEITARFTGLMDAASLRSSGFHLAHAGSDGQVGTADDLPLDVSTLSFSAVSNRMSFMPATPLRSGRYRATLTTNAVDILGNALAAAVSWNFSVPFPSVTSVEPPDGHARPVNGISSIQVGFSEPMNPDSLAIGFTLALTNGSPTLGGVVDYDPATQLGTLRFSGPLPAGEYRFQVTSNATDRFGNPVNPAFSSRFGVHGPVSWAVDADGNWNTATNWTPHRPGLADDVVINRPAGVFTISHTSGQSLVNTLESAENLSLTGGTLTIRSNSFVRGSLSLQNATLSNAADLRVDGPVTFGSNASLIGPGQLTLGGPATLQGGSLANSVGIAGQRIIVEAGPLSWTTGNVDPYDSSASAHWIIGPGATLEAIAGTTSRDWQARQSTIWNRGTFRQSGTTNRLRWISLSVTNDGLWDITAGQADVQGSLVQSGRLAIAADSSLRLSGDTGTFQLAEGGVIEGAGEFSVRRKETQIAGRIAMTGGATFESLTASITGRLEPGNGALSFINTDVVFDNGPLALPGPVTLREGTLDFRHPTSLGDLRWNFGRIHANAAINVSNFVRIGDITVGNGAEVSGPGPLRLLNGAEFLRFFTLETNAVLEHAGRTVWRPLSSSQLSGITFDPGAIFRNLPDGTFEIATNRNFTGRGTFENLGTLVKPNNLFTNAISVALESPGNLQVEGGLLVVSAGGTLGGTVHIANDAALEITGNNLVPQWRLSGRFTGGGALRILGGSNHLSGSLQGPQLALAGGVTHLRLPANILLTNAEIRGGTMWCDGNLTLSGTNTLLSGRDTRVRGDVILRNDGSLIEGATWLDTDVENAGTWTYTTSLPPRYTRTFRNLPGATFTLTNITSVPSNDPEPGAFDNAGLVRKLGTRNAFLPFAFTNRGVIEISGSLSFHRAFIQTETGLTRLTGGRLAPEANPNFLGGEFHGPGIIGSDGSSFNRITNSAHLRPGGPNGFGTLSFNTPAAYLTLESRVTLRIGGPTPDTEHDQLRGSSVLWLGGSLRLEFVQGFNPAVGSKFLIVSASSRNRTFQSTFESVGLPAGKTVRLNYLPAGVEAEIIAGP